MSAVRIGGQNLSGPRDEERLFAAFELLLLYLFLATSANQQDYVTSSLSITFKLFLSVLRPIDSLYIDTLLVHFPQRAQIPQPRNDIDDLARDKVNLSLSCEPSDPESDRGVCHVFFCS